MIKRYCHGILKCLQIHAEEREEEAKIITKDIEENDKDYSDHNVDSDTTDSDISITIMDTPKKCQIIHKIYTSLPKQPLVPYRDYNLYQKFYLRNNFFINDFGRKRILFINCEKKSRFPIKGWLHKCMECGTPTGQHFILNGIIPKNIYVHICDICYYKLENGRKDNSLLYNDFISEVNYILTHLSQGQRHMSY